MNFYKEKDLAMCGLACVLCSDESCRGCKERGCKDNNDCSICKCVTEKKLDGCYQCDKFPCEEKMFQGIQIKAFNRYAMKYGKQDLLERLQINFENGVSYHRSDGLAGDYDSLSNEDEIMRLLRFGSHDPYIKCPVLETDHFILRLVQTEDAEELLKCYSDSQSQEVFNADNCTSDFCYNTIEEMKACIDMWIDCYIKRYFVRFSVVDKETKNAIGTVEMFCSTDPLAGYESWGVLRLDLTSPYEKQSHIKEIITLCHSSFYELFGAKLIITKAIPKAKERIEVLRMNNFKPFELNDEKRKYYWCHDRG